MKIGKTHLEKVIFPDSYFFHIRCREPAFLLSFWFVVLLLDANGYFLMSLVVSAFHELAHILIYHFLIGEWPDCFIGFSGICMHTWHKNLPRWKEIWITAAGPGMNLLLAEILYLMLQNRSSFFRLGWFWANLLIGMFNLLPIPPLDGWHLIWLIFKKN